MKRSDLQRFVAQDVFVPIGDFVFKLKSPDWETVTNVQNILASGEATVDQMLKAMKIALQATLVFENEPDNPPTEKEVESILISTGMARSKVARMALELCGLQFSSSDDEDDTEDKDEDIAKGKDEDISSYKSQFNDYHDDPPF